MEALVRLEPAGTEQHDGAGRYTRALTHGAAGVARRKALDRIEVQRVRDRSDARQGNPEKPLYGPHECAICGDDAVGVASAGADRPAQRPVPGALQPSAAELLHAL